MLTGVTINESWVAQRRRNRHTLDGFLLMWLDSNIKDEDDDFQNSLGHLQDVVAAVNVFNRAGPFMDFLNELTTENVFLIVSGPDGESLVEKIHRRKQLISIYIFCGNISSHQQWSSKWSKIKGVYTDIESICERLQDDHEQCMRSSISMSFSGIDPLFMYSQLFKETLLEIQDDGTDKDMENLSTYCRIQINNMESEMRSIGKKSREQHRDRIDKVRKDMKSLEGKYRNERPIYWYTCESFLYRWLNQALRQLEVDTIYAMGFFIRHLHKDIAELQQEQGNRLEPFTAYRGQRLLTIRKLRYYNLKAANNEARVQVHALISFAL